MTTTTTLTLDAEYYVWLTEQIDIPNHKQYFDLFERLHNVEFVWIVPNDDNRVQDAIDLRNEFVNFLNENPIRRKINVGELTLGGATCLEVVIALSHRVAFIASGNGHAPQWAWTLIKNLGLQKYSDPLTSQKARNVDNILHSLIWRDYHADGRGGFFPLRNPEVDQTKIEIWHQLNAYVTEMTDL